MGLFDFLNAKNLKAVADVLEDAVTNAVEQVTESVENHQPIVVGNWTVMEYYTYTEMEK